MNRRKLSFIVTLIMLFIMGINTQAVKAVKSAKSVKSAAAVGTVGTTAISTPRIVGYFPDWSIDSNSLTYQQIQYQKLTHINYCFLEVKSDGSLITPNLTRMRQVINEAHKYGVKVLISVGGGNNSSTLGTAVVSSQNTLVNNLQKFVSDNSIDGIDIDWEGIDSTIKSSAFTSLINKLSSNLHTQGKSLSCCVDTGNGCDDKISSTIFGYIDFVNVMAYDGPGIQHSPYIAAQNGIQYWTSRGLARSKINIGVPAYGYNSTAGERSWEEMPYNTIIKSAGANALQAAYSDSYNGYYYNGVNTIKLKAQLAKDNGCGIMMWELIEDTTDDSTSLLNAIYTQFRL